MAYKFIYEGDRLLQIADLLVKDDILIALDTETGGLYHKDLVAGFSISWKAGQSIYVPINHKHGNNCDLQSVLLFFDKIKALRIVYHNVLFDRLMIFSNFKRVLPIFADTMLYAYVLGNTGKNLGLKVLSMLELNKHQKEFSALMKDKFGHKWKKEGFSMLDMSSEDEDLLKYACEDADFTLQLFHKLKPRITKDLHSIVKIEENLLPIVMKMNFIGAPVDKPMLVDAVEDFEKGIEITYANIQKEYKQISKDSSAVLKINSPKEVGNLLFTTLGLPILKRSPATGTPSTDKDVMADLADEHVIVPLLDSYRKESRMLKAYVKKIPDGVDENDRIHSVFSNLGAVSGRFTSSSVTDGTGLARGLNLQNIPKEKGNRKIDMRTAFIAPKGWTLVRADYSQIEYRVMASLSKEPFMCSNFKKGVDFHSTTAAIMFGINPEDISEDQRNLGKVFNFGLSYGMTAKGLAAKVGCSEEEASHKMESYFAKLPLLVNLINAAKARAIREGATYTFFGRKRELFLAGLPSNAKEKVLRKSFNTMIQGTAADLLKIAMLRISDQVLAKFKKDIELIMTVHDELVFLVRDPILEESLPAIKYAMEVPVPADWVDLEVDISFGPNWSASHQKDYKAPSSYSKEKFTSWNNVMPPNLSFSLKQ